MTQLAHLSDLHFGAIDDNVAEELARELSAEAPDLCVVTGDLTQRARPREFELVRQFLSSLPCEALVVPGNHDVPPLFQPVRRALTPFRRYRKHLDHQLDPSWTDDLTLVIGLNTVRPLRWKEGTLTPRVLARLREQLTPFPDSIHVVAMHHPPEHPAGARRGTDAWRSKSSLLDALTVDLALSGHLHVGGHWLLRAAAGGGTVLVQAPTATSHRTRGEPNGYNRIRLRKGGATLSLRAWTGAGFDTVRTSELQLSRHRKQDNARTD